jgi:Protein of unknown function (DUF3983)
MTDKKKKRLRKSIARRNKEIEKDRLEKAWRNLFVKSGYLKQ